MKPTQSCLQRDTSSCERILHINKLHEASVKKEQGFGERGVPAVFFFLPLSTPDSEEQEAAELARISYKW